MNNDRELLELAARAAGIGLDWTKADGYGGPFNMNSKGLPVWNPFTDDGDALRLAVKLKLIVQVCPNGTQVIHNSFDIRNYIIEEHFDDPYAATRRAIVRAAAVIGREMK